jgi:hypothetical protein
MEMEHSRESKHSEANYFQPYPVITEEENMQRTNSGIVKLANGSDFALLALEFKPFYVISFIWKHSKR